MYRIGPSVHSRNAAFEQYCSTPLLKVERSVLNTFLKRSESSLTLLSEQKLQRNLVLVNNLFKSKESVANCMTDRAPIQTGNALEQFLHRNGTSILVLETEQKPLWYSVNIALVQ